MKASVSRNFILTLCIIFSLSKVNAQNGIESIIVEKYYVSNASDATGSIGVLPAGSVTYRIFVDMLQGYKFQMAYGTAIHPLFINTTTSFFNNEDYGSTNPTFSKANAAKNTVMLDSWLSAGAACANNFGILKSEDNGVSNIVNTNGLLQNNNSSAGIPLTSQDGIISVSGRSPGAFGTLGIDAEIAVFDATSQAGNSFTVSNGSWYCLAGAMGPDTVSNKVLIAQITTNGVLSFELNIQIGTPSGGVQNYVANNPVMYNGQMEISIPSLTYNSTTVSVQDISSSENSFSVYPNPADDQLTIDFTGADQNSDNSFYKIYDVLGKVRFYKDLGIVAGKHVEQINVASLIDGIYFVELNINGSSYTKKIIKR
jgi:hypothetical protein